MSKTLVTHDGKFHADDVFAVAAVLLAEEEVTVARTRDEKRIADADIVVDVGGIYDEKTGRFDHHQKSGAGVRENSIPSASFGLVWKCYGEKLAGSKAVAQRVDEVLVTPIDANDSGIDLGTPIFANVSWYDVSDMVRAFTPTWEEDASLADEYFSEITLFAKRIIAREINRAKAVIEGERQVEGAALTAPDKRLIVLPVDYSWKGVLMKFSEPLYVVHPQGDTWRLYCVRDNPHVFRNRKDLPSAWAGLRDEELAKVTGVPDAVFAHRNRFMAVAKTREGAVALATIALNS